MKYKVGDKVRVRINLVPCEKYGSLTFLDGSMSKCAGQICTIKEVLSGKKYHVSENPFGWSEEMLEPVVSTLAKIKENNLRCVIKVDSKEEAVKLFEIFNPNDYDVNYVYGYLMLNYWKGDGTVCFSVVGDKINGFDTETSYKKYEEQYGKIYRFKDLVAKESGIVTLKPRDESVSFASTPYLDLSLVLPTNSRELEEKFNKELAEYFNAFPNGFRGGKKPEYVLNEKQAKEYADNIMATAELISDIAGISYENSINKLKTCLGTFPNDGISAKNGGKNSMKFTFYVKEGTRPDKKCNGLIPTMTTTVVDASGKKATVTCDKADYSERQGVLEAIAQLACGGNFDKEYNKAVKKNKLIELHDRTCTYCGKVFGTIAEREAEEAWHVECKKTRRERYLLRKRAKEIAFEEAAQKMAKKMIEEDK